jgi:hypothetical protein
MAQTDDASKPQPKLRWWPAAPRRKQPIQTYFARALVDLCEEYFEIPTGLRPQWTTEGEEEIERKSGPIVELGETLAPIWGIEPPSGAVFAKAKGQLKRWRRAS